MNFGQVPTRQLNKIDFELPAEPPINDSVLKGKTTKKPAVYVGCAKWSRKEWIGIVYPEGTKEKDFLHEYAKRLNSVELNATHYKLYKAADLEKWVEHVGNRNFKFAPKLYQGITHFGNLRGKEVLTDVFLQNIITLGKNLGPVFIQVADKFSPKRKEELFDYLISLPRDVQFFLEVRHPDWFVKPEADELFNTLRKLKIGSVITDVAGRRDCCHMHLTVPKAFIRYVGNNLHKTDFARMDAWVQRMKYWLDKGIKEIYFFMHMSDETFSPKASFYLDKKLNDACGPIFPTPS
ncbi:MAG TPA: DUF72 domain-containing protein [Flavisolibacter sp.]